MKKSNLVIRKSSAVIQISAKELSAVQRKIINALIYLIQRSGKAEVYKTTSATLKKLCNIKSMGNDEIKYGLKQLADIKMEFNYLNKDRNEVWGYMSLLSEVEFIPNEGVINYSFPPSLRNRIINPNIYTPLDIVMISGLKSSYSIVLYEFLRDYITSPVIPQLTIESFRKLMGIKEDEYSKEFNDFKRRVLDVAVKEVNEKTDINCGYELIKESGNKYSKIQFKAFKQKNNHVENEKTQLEFSFGNESIPCEVISTQAQVVESSNQESLICAEVVLTDSQKQLVLELFETIGVKQDKALSVVEEYPEDKIRQAMKYTKTIKRKNPAGFFLKALAEEYILPVKQGDESSEIEGLRQKALKCYPSGQAGSCGSEYQNNPRHSCYWCPKWENRRKMTMI